jgi:hypothetical protein
MRIRSAVAGVLLLGLAIPALFAKKKDPQPDPVMTEVTARGRMLYECDQAAWHSSDALMATNPSKESLGRYIPQKSGSGWVVGFGRLNQARDKFLVAYEAIQGATLQDFTVKKFDPPREDTHFYLFAARAVDTALADFQGEHRSYNAAVLPAPSNQLYVYILPAQTKDDVFPLGGDVRYLVSPEGTSIIEKHQMHKSIIENPAPVKGAKTVAGVHTHVLSDVPEDSDVFHVLTRKPSVPEYIMTSKKGGYLVREDGTIIPWKR